MTAVRQRRIRYRPHTLGWAAALLLTAALPGGARAQSAPPFQPGRAIPWAAAHLPWPAGHAWAYRQGTTRLVAGLAQPVHVKPGVWRLALAGHTNQPGAHFLAMLVYPPGPYSLATVGWGRTVQCTANAQGDWLRTWPVPSQYLANGKATLQLLEYAPGQAPSLKTLLLRALTGVPLAFGRNHDFSRNNVVVGTSVQNHSPILPVSGTVLHANQTLFARLYVWPALQTTSATLLVLHKEGDAWVTVVSQPITTEPDATFVVQPFAVGHAGVYRVAFLANNSVLASATITVRP